MIDKRQVLNECKQIEYAFGKLSYEDVVDLCIEAVEADMAELKELKDMVKWMENNSNTSLCDYYNREVK